MAGLPKPPASVHAGLGGPAPPLTELAEIAIDQRNPTCIRTHPLIEPAEIAIDRREPSQVAGSTDPSGPSGGIRFTRSAIRPSMSATRFLRPQFCSCFSRP